MATSKVENSLKEIKIGETTFTIPADTRSVSITAEVPSGYKFLCWIEIISSGWVGHLYPATPRAQTTTIWTTESISSAERTGKGYFIYYK